MRTPVRHGALAVVALGLVILAGGCGKGTSSTGPGTAITQDAIADTFLVNGASDDTLLNRFRSYDGTRTRYFHWVSSLAIANVEIPRGGNYPVSGTVTFTVTADRLRSNSVSDIESHWNATVVITFNG